MNPAADNQSIPSNQTPPQKPSNSKLLILFLLTLILGGLGGYLIGSSKSDLALLLSPKGVPNNPLASAFLPSPTPDLTANWKTYFSDRCSFKFPTDLSLQERQNNYIVLLSDPNNPQSGVISIDARLIGTYADYAKSITTTKTGLTNVKSQEINNGVKISGIIGSGEGEGKQITIALLKYQQSAIELEITSTDPVKLQLFDQILSTFKFLN